MFSSRINRNLIDRASVIVGLLLASCSLQMTPTPGGGYAITHLGVGPSRMPVALHSSQRAASPPSSALSSSPVTPVSLDGVYSGMASLLSTGGGNCLTNEKVTNFRVSGNSVHWGGFRGTIDRNRGVQTTYRGNWLFGEFIGTQFSGVLQRTGNLRNGNPRCYYRLLLRRG
jgi:hypothetical protein